MQTLERSAEAAGLARVGLVSGKTTEAPARLMARARAAVPTRPA